MTEEQQGGLSAVCKHFIKKRVSTRWKDLADCLGLEWADVDNIAGRNPDDQSRCRDMLEVWQGQKGDAATIQVLMEALSEAGLKKVVDDFKEKYSGKKGKRKRKRKRRRKSDHSPEEVSSESKLSVKDDLPSHNYFPLVAKAVGSSWVKFAVEQLGLTAQDIHTIQLRQPYSKQQQALQALELWRDRRGRKACRVKLAAALRRGGFLHTADEVDRYNGHEVKVNGLITEKPAYSTNHTLQCTEPTHKKRKTQDPCGCSLQLKQESEQSHNVACPESNGANGWNTVEQRAGTSSNGTQHLNGRAVNGCDESNSTTSWSSQHQESSSSTSGEESEYDKVSPPSTIKQEKNRKRKKSLVKDDQTTHTMSGKRMKSRSNWEENTRPCKDSCGMRKRRQKTVKTKMEKNASSSGGNTQNTDSIYHTIVKMAEETFDDGAYETLDEFDQTVQDLENFTAIVIKTEDKKAKLSVQVKAQIKKRVNDKIAEVANKILERKLFDKKCRSTLHKMMRCFERFEAALRKAETGCVLCHLDFSDVGCYDTFWRGYCDDSLSDTLTQELITDDMRAAEGGADLYIHVRVLHSVTEEGDFSDQDPSGTAGRGPPHPGPSGEHTGQGPPAPGSSNHGDDTPPGYHGDDTGGRQASGGDDVIQVKQEPAEQVPPCCMLGTVKSEIKGELVGPIPKREETELDRQLGAVADHLGSMWERLALFLGFNTDYIRDLTGRLSPIERPRQLMIDWMERNAGDVTLDQLVQALRDAGIHEVADAVDSGQLFVTEAEYEAAKGKPDGDMDTGGPEDAAASGQLFVTEAEYEAAKGKPDGDMDTGGPEGGGRLPDDSDSESSEVGGSDGNISEGSNTSEEDESTSDSLDSGSHSSKGSPSVYPTGEDALAWNDCLQDFFKTDEDTARSIQESWPSNLLVKHLIRDRFFHSYLCEYWKQYQSFPDTLSGFVEFVTKVSARKFFSQNDMSDEKFKSAYESLCLVLGKLAYENESNNQQCLVHQSQLEWDDVHQCSLGLLQPVSEDHDDSGSFQFVHDSIQQFLIAHWVVHSVTTDTEGEQQLKNFFKKSAALPLSCYCVAHLLGQSDGHRNHLLHFVDLLIQSDTQLGTFDHLLHVVSTAVESKQLQILTPSVQALFPEKTLDLLSLPEISFHGLHSLTTFMSKTIVATKIKLPNKFSCKNLLKMYPFSKSKSAKDVSHYQQIRCLSYLPLFQTESQYAESLYFKRTDEALVIDHIEKYLLHCPSLTTLTFQQVGVDIEGFSKILPCFLFAPSLRVLTFRGTKSSVRDDIKSNAQSVARRCLASCRELNVLRITYLHIVDLPPLPNLEEIDLSHNAISDEAVPGLSKGLGSCQNLKKVNLCHNKLSDRGDFLPSLPNLEEIDLSHNAISDEAVPGLAECLGSCQNLKKVYLSCNKLSDRGDILPPLPNLEEIDLSHNNINDKAVPGLAEGFASCQNLKKVDLSHNKLSDRGDILPPLPNLEEIDLSHNAISDEAVPGVAKFLSSCENLKTVHLNNDKISNKGLLLWLLQGQNKQLQLEIGENISGDLVSLLSNSKDASQVTKLDLRRGKDYCWYAAPLRTTEIHLLLQFLPQLSNLQGLALCVSCQGEEEAELTDQLYGVQPPLKTLKLTLRDCSSDKMTRLLTLLLQRFPLLEAIDLSRSDISDEAVPGLAKGLASCQNLKKVDLSHNKLSDRGDVLPPLPNLEEVDLSHNAVSDEAVPGLAEGLSLCQNLKKVNLSYNKLSDRGDFLPPLPNLEKIDLSHNVISDEAVPGLAQGLGSCQNLKHVRLTDNKISNKGALLLLLQVQCKHMQVETARNNISDDLVSLLSNRQNATQEAKLFLMVEEYPWGTVSPLSITSINLLLQFLPQLPNLQELALCVSCQGEEEAELKDQLYGVQPPLRTLKLMLRHWSLDKMTKQLTLILQQFPLLEVIDLSRSDISDEAVPGLAEGLGSCQNLKKVNLRQNKLSNRGDFLPPLPNLEEIDLSHNAISDEAVPGVAKFLSSCENIKTVRLTNNRISNKGLLLWLLQGQYKQLQLEIGGNISGDLVSLLSNSKDASQLTKLDLTRGKDFWQYWSNVAPLRTSEVHLLLQFLPQLPNLQELALCVSCQGEEEAEHINQLYGVRDLLKKLKLKDWSLDNMIILSTQMFQHFHMLEEIDLSDNVISDEGVPGFAKGLASCQNLKKVDLSHNKLSNRGDLPPLPNLEEIDLSHNVISDEAVPGLAKGLASCQNLKKVDLSHNKLSDIRELMKVFITLPILISVDIEYNSIHDESLPTIAAWLNVRTAVEEVRLYYNRFSAEGVRDFVRTMKGKAYSGYLLYDGSQADVGESVEPGGEGARREEQQWERLRRETDWINVKVRQLIVEISHEGRRLNNTQLVSP